MYFGAYYLSYDKNCFEHISKEGFRYFEVIFLFCDSTSCTKLNLVLSEGSRDEYKSKGHMKSVKCDSHNQFEKSTWLPSDLIFSFLENFLKIWDSQP